ncbi:F-box/LRR-repeat protein At3g58900-like [Carex rostrata]
MDPTQSSTKKRRKIAVEDVDVDRISELGNDMLILILSLLSTKEAVQTSLLSKRFQNLWAAVPVLEFDFHEFRVEYIEEDEDEEDIYDIQEKIINFINGVVKHRDPIINLDSFKLKWDEEGSNPKPATTWLDNVAAKFKLKFLSVHIFTEKYDFKVPDSIFSCESLQEMKLHLEGEDIWPTSLNLPCLKKLTLDSIEIVDEVMQKLLELPSLAEMVLSWCDLNICNISSVKLKRLVLDCELNPETPRDISISTPNLLYLEVHSSSMRRIKFNNLESLVKACMFANEVPLFLTGLSNVTCLELMLLSQWGVLQMKGVWKEETTKFPTFNNLKSLKIEEWRMTNKFELVASFLLHARNLEKMTLLHARHCQVCIVIYKLMILTKTNLSLNYTQFCFDLFQTFILKKNSHYKVEISLGFAGDNFLIMEIKGNNFKFKEIKGMEKDKIKADIKELLKRVYNTLLKIRPEMYIISS